MPWVLQGLCRKNQPMETLVKKFTLENGLVICLYDHTIRYYGDFYHVKIEIVLEVDLREEYFGNLNDYSQAQLVLGKSVTYRRFIEQMGVPSTGIERVRELLIQNFKEHSLPYFSTSNFVRKFVLSHYDKSKKRLNRQVIR